VPELRTCLLALPLLDVDLGGECTAARCGEGTGQLRGVEVVVRLPPEGSFGARRPRPCRLAATLDVAWPPKRRRGA